MSAYRNAPEYPALSVSPSTCYAGGMLFFRGDILCGCCCRAGGFTPFGLVEGSAEEFIVVSCNGFRRRLGPRMWWLPSSLFYLLSFGIDLTVAG